MKKQERQQEILEVSRKIKLDINAAETILDFVASRLLSLTSTSRINIYAISNYFDLDGIEKYKTNTIKKEGTGENSTIKHDALRLDKFHATQSLLHLLFAWQELGQLPPEKYVNGNYKDLASLEKACAKEIDLSAILDSISASATDQGRFLAFVLIDENTREEPFKIPSKFKFSTSLAKNPPNIVSSLEKTINARKSSSKALQKRWEKSKKNYRDALDIIEYSICVEGMRPNWKHNDFVNWILNHYTDKNGDNPFKTIKDENGKVVYSGLSRETLLMKTANMFRTIGIGHRIEGERKPNQ